MEARQTEAVLIFDSKIEGFALATLLLTKARSERRTMAISIDGSI